MKRLMIILTAFCFISNIQTTQAQEVSGGIKGGLNMSNLYIDNVDDENMRIGYHAGFYGQIHIDDKFLIQPELLFSTKGAHAYYNGIFNQDVRFNLNYIDLPVLASVELGEFLVLQAGGYASYLISANTDYSNSIVSGFQELDRDNFHSVDYGLVAGVAANFEPIQIGVRYSRGLSEIAQSNVAEIQLGDSKNSVAQLYIAFGIT
ncbi:porin family protein [Salibacter halophilus]|uniref:PorT family protein n=1 Tax=Salibacter halophilus TaxID=1803916 RepID=A0A6N6M7N7_9FLAO|nr:porin family protein [Salibacter halophilus]KAB1064530.1 PorT family protein [Salibacter halophilus]